jgi:branched-chain amino acid transport system permease protein
MVTGLNQDSGRARERTRALKRPVRNSGMLVVVALVLVILPLVVGASLQVAFTDVLYTILLGIGWNVTGGFGGQFALGQTLFLGIGAYGTAWLLDHGVSAVVGLVAGMIVSMIVSFALGNLLFRRQLQDFYFGLVTLAFASGMGYTVQNIGALGGPNGLIIPVLNSSLDLVWPTIRPYYYFALILAVCAAVVSWFLYRSPSGWKMRAVVADEASAVAVGINPVKSKVQAFVVSSVIISAAGSFYVCQNQLVNSDSVLSLTPLLLMLAGPIVGGLGTIVGPIVGGLIVGGVQQGLLLLPLTATTGGVITNAVFGLALIVIPLVAPSGIVGWIAKRQRGRTSDALSSHFAAREGQLEQETV